MVTKRIVLLTVLAVMFAFVAPGFAQVTAESTTRGNLAVTVVDPSGAVVPNAKVTISGPTGNRTATTDNQGDFSFLVLIPGTYGVKVEHEGFKTAALSAVGVETGRTTSARVKLEPGTISQVVEVTASAITVDTTSTAVGSNLGDDFYARVPVARNVAGLFYAAPGVAGGGGTGRANPSISGGSGLENSYVADGVDITDTAFGGLGIFSRVYGSVGTGINLSFIKEVDVKTGGYEPQYGKTTGGVVQIVTKSGGNQYHGEVAGFFQPQQFEASRVNPDDFGRFNQTGRLNHVAGYDVDGEIGGYVPGMRDRLFFFGSFNPSWGYRYVQAPSVVGLSSLGTIDRKTTTYNYAAKVTAKLTDKHQLEGSVFGDPAHTPVTANRRVNEDNTTGFSKNDFGSRNAVVRYNGTLSPTWLVNASITWMHNHFTEGNFDNSINEVTNLTETGFDRFGVAVPTASLATMRGQYVMSGLGFIENTVSDNYGFDIDTSKIFHAAGEHTFSIGYRYERPFYDGGRSNSGPVVPLPTTNADGALIGSSLYQQIAADPALQLANYNWSLKLASTSCTLCPLMNVNGIGQAPVYLRIIRSEAGLQTNGFKNFQTSGKYSAAYANDSWSPNKYVTLNLGVRWEQQFMQGQNSQYTFTDNWSPRIGVSVDPFGDRKTKIFANFGRYSYAIPLDLAERSLTNELDMFSLRVIPAFTTDAAGNRITTVNPDGSVTPMFDPAHVIAGATGGTGVEPFMSAESGEAIHSGTKMSYLDEWVVGAEHEFPGGVVASVKYLHRDLRRIVEDTGGISPEAANAGIPQLFSIANVNANTDIFTNPPEIKYQTGTDPLAAGCPVDTTGEVLGTPGPIVLDPVTDSFGNTVPPGAACFGARGVNGAPSGSLLPDGIPDGFSNPERLYWAVELEANKAFSKNWLLRANWRIAKLLGNFEGAFRNDNGQSDPSISSLFDFTPGLFGLLGDQFAIGPLNTDRRHIVNAFFSYYVDHGPLKGLTVGPAVNFQTGVPINDLKAHPVYLNSGEVPEGGRGALGRTRAFGQVDAHLEYSHPVTEKTSLQFGADLFNIANSKRQLFVDQNEDLQFGQRNVDFQKPANQAVLGDGFMSPFSARLSVKFVF
jgi:hypothetical protein